MFDKNTASELIPFTASWFDINFSIGPITLYPIVQPLIGIIFIIMCLAVYGAIRFIYYIKDNINKKRTF